MIADFVGWLNRRFPAKTKPRLSELPADKREKKRERNRVYMAAYYAKNREKIREQARARHAKRRAEGFRRRYK